MNTPRINAAHGVAHGIAHDAKHEAEHDAAREVGAASESHASAAAIGDFLTDQRVVIDLEVSSRKRLFEQLANLLLCGNIRGDFALAEQDDTGVDLDSVLHILTKREKLGCTGIGNGIAIPHGRVEGLAAPLMAIARLRNAIHYDATDGVPVWLAVCLLVPANANDTHLRLLAELASRFTTPGFAARLKASTSAAELAAHFTNPPLSD